MDETIAKQITSMIERHNMLVEEINTLDREHTQKNAELEIFKQNVQTTLEILRRNLDEINSLVEKTQRYKKAVANEFKQIVKADSLARLNSRINNLHLEENIFRKELYSWLEKS